MTTSETVESPPAGRRVERLVRTDWRGLPIPDGETPQTRIKWWEVDPHPTRKGYVLRERSWQDMLTFVGGSLDLLLERDGVETEGMCLKFRVCEGTIEQYNEEMVEE